MVIRPSRVLNYSLIFFTRIFEDKFLISFNILHDDTTLYAVYNSAIKTWQIVLINTRGYIEDYYIYERKR